MDVLRRIFGVDKPLIAMCHLRALPGRPRHDAEAGMDAVVDSLAADVAALQDAGVDGLLFCNEHDLPYQLAVGPEIPAAMAAAVGRLRPVIARPFGVNILWDPRATLAVAPAPGAAFRCQGFSGGFGSGMGVPPPGY